MIYRYFHCKLTSSSVIEYFTMRIKLLEAPSTGYDNYMYIIIDEASKQCAVVDPVEADTVR